MGWFKKIETDKEKTDKLLSDFNVTYKYTSSDKKFTIALDDVNQILGYINLDYGSGELETMRYSEIEAVNYHVNDKDGGGFVDLEAMTKKEVEEFIGITKKHLTNAIHNTGSFSNIGGNIETMYREKDFYMSFFKVGMRKPPVSKSNPAVQSSIEKFLEFNDILSSAILMAKKDK